MRHSIALLVLPLAACALAQAQEPGQPTWTTSLGSVVYTGPDGSSGAFEYPVPFGDNIGRLYIEGLTDEFRGPGPLTGYWSEPDVSHDDENDTTLICPFNIIDSTGRNTRNWGQLKIMFLEDAFPGDFIVLRGRCFETPKDALAGRLKR
jgi:hypothetical protein